MAIDLWPNFSMSESSETIGIPVPGAWRPNLRGLMSPIACNFFESRFSHCRSTFPFVEAPSPNTSYP